MNLANTISATSIMSSSTPQATASQVDVAGNAIIAMLARVLYLVTRLCVPPVVLAHISLTEYGLWTACFILIMYVGLTDVGISNVYVRFTARYYTEGNIEKINRLLSTGVIMLSGMAVLVLSVVWVALPLVLDFLKIDALYREKASILVLGTTGIYLLDLTLGAYCYLLHGLQRIKEQQKITMSSYLLEVGLIFILLQVGIGVYALLIAFALRYIWSLISFMRLSHRILPGLQLRPRHFDKTMLRHFFGFGATIQISTLMGTALYSLDRLIAGFLLGPKGIALFELAAKLPASVLSVPSAICNVTLATASQHDAEKNTQSIRDLHQEATRSICMIAAIPLGFMAIFSTPISNAWLNNSALIEMPLIMTLVSISAHLHITTGPGSAILRATGKVWNEFIYHSLRCGLIAIFLTLCLTLLPSSTQGLAYGLSLGDTLAATIYLFVMQRLLGLPLRNLLTVTLLPALFVYPLAAAFKLIWEVVVPLSANRWETIGWLGLFGTLYTATYCLICWRWLLTSAERERLIELRGKVLGKLPQWITS